MTRDPRTDPQPGDIFRDPLEDFPRKVLKREVGWVLLEIGANNHVWVKLATWRKWSAQERIVMALVVSNQEG